MAQFDVTITEMWSTLDNLRTLRARTLADLRMRKNDLVPINRLPHEIFVQILEQLRKVEKKQWYRAMEVCRQWRDIAISSPLFWTTIVGHFLSDLLAEDTSTYSRLWLHRAKQAPLDVWLVVGDSSAMDHPLLLDLGARCGQIGSFFAGIRSTLSREAAAAFVGHFSSAATSLRSLLIQINRIGGPM